MFVIFTNEVCLFVLVHDFSVWYPKYIYLAKLSLFTTLGNKIRADEQKKKEKAAKEEQKKAYGAILQLKQRQRAEVVSCYNTLSSKWIEKFKIIDQMEL